MSSHKLKESYYVGVDIGSTTLKVVVLNKKQELIFGVYERHYANISSTLKKILKQAYEFVQDGEVTVAMTGSAGMSLAKRLGIHFVQEVVATTKILRVKHPQADVAIELGGEDAKVIYLTDGVEQRMNGTCAGGTGSFIDQMAGLLQVDAAQLNELAKAHQTIYPIAARCGVFAKTDVQPLLNEGVSKEDIAISILQAVVVQTISGLSCGRPIKGNVAFLGGPLYFLSELRQRFIETLNLSEEQIIFPTDSQLYIAMGAAISGMNSNPLAFTEFMERVSLEKGGQVEDLTRLAPLFESSSDYQKFQERHDLMQVKRQELATFKGKCFLGIDSGSTTTKVTLINEIGELLFTHYGSNEGSPLYSTIKVLKSLYELLPKEAEIAYATVTGYGEALLKSALKIDVGEIETVAHYKAANYFAPGVSFILDIGGQDMKCLKIQDGNITNISLNEACSAGCGSFLDTFAKSMNLSIEKFVEVAIASKQPVELGSRCTVFMNSRVKQAQKEGASIGDIAAGLSYSVIRNALYKVIKIRDPKDLGNKIVVQGGTFYNDAVLRAFELLTDCEVVRPDIAGMMGAFGAALIAREQYQETAQSTLVKATELDSFQSQTKTTRCRLCSNHCLLTIHRFEGGGRFVSGNRCERGVGKTKTSEKLPNLVAYKEKRTFDYPVLERCEASRGVVGLPRVLNMFENYPFWAAFFTELGFGVVLSDKSSKTVYEQGMATIPSESACYPAKLVHGHVLNLIEKQVDVIFYPSLIYSHKEDLKADNQFNCPVVISYPEVIKNNVDELRQQEIPFLNPFLPFTDPKKLVKRLYEELLNFGVLKSEVQTAVNKALKVQVDFREDIQRKGEETLADIQKQGLKGIVLGGRPYHMDSHINHGIPEMINALGMAVLTEDSVCHLGEIKRPLRVMDQWVYHTRLYGAAQFVALREDLELVQLNSFGCGLDAVTTDQVEEILASHSKLYTTLKIDEGDNLGAVRIRLRSLKAAMLERQQKNYPHQVIDNSYHRQPFTDEMRKTHTILVPQLSPIHFDILQHAFNYSGYQLVVLPSNDHEAVEEGLRYVNNDACYPAILVVGQIIEALKSGKYNIHQTSILLSQTGGGCRASNYIGFLRKALRDNGMEHVPVISLSAQNFEQNPGFKISVSLANRALMALVYGDLLMNVLYRTRPYEIEKGSSQRLYEKWTKVCIMALKRAKFSEFKHNLKAIVKSFDELPITDVVKPRVGLVGEILVKFHPTANNQVVEVIESEGAEAVMPGLIDFLLYCCYKSDYKLLDRPYMDKWIGDMGIAFIEKYRQPMKAALTASNRFVVPPSIQSVAHDAKKVISLGHRTGEGWLLTGEMVELIEMGVPNIVCMQPFACLPNHITGKGVIKALRKEYPFANVVAVDYDPGASEVNQLNRIKLMIATAFENLDHQTTEAVENNNLKDVVHSLGKLTTIN